jgi:hypothetical protein
LLDEDRFREEDILAVGVGVPARETRGLSGGGPIEPITRSFEVDEGTLARALRIKAGALVAGVSTPLRCFRPSRPESEMIEEGRERDGVEKTFESRR